MYGSHFSRPPPSPDTSRQKPVTTGPPLDISCCVQEWHASTLARNHIRQLSTLYAIKRRKQAAGYLALKSASGATRPPSLGSDLYSVPAHRRSRAGDDP